jgi:hypothetical protein
VILGDWPTAPFLRDPIDLIRASFLVGALAFLFAREPGSALTLIVPAGVAVLVARLVNLPRVYDLAFCLAMVLTGWGEALKLYDEFGWYDNVVHFLSPLFACQVAYIALARLEVVPDPRDEIGTHENWGLFAVTFALGVAIGGLWELVEWASDSWLGSDLQLSNEDSMGDLLADSLGSLTGAALLVLWSVQGWGSVRRIPGENRYEETNA